MVIPMARTTFWMVRTKGMIGNTKDMCEFVISYYREGQDRRRPTKKPMTIDRRVKMALIYYYICLPPV